MKDFPHICFLGVGHMARRHQAMLRKLYPQLKTTFATREGSGKEADFTSYEAAIQSRDVDIVFIVTPHAFHADLAVAAARERKDVIIEKPVTRTLDELDRVQCAVSESGVRCVVAENYQFKPLYHRIRQCVEDGLIGQPLIVELSKTARQRATGWRTDPELMGGGALLEGGVHWVNALVTLAGGMPVAVCALKPGVAYGMVSPLEDTLLLTVKFDNGVLGKLTHSWHIPNPFLGLGSSRVYGTEGVIAFESNGLVACVFGKRRKLIWASPFRFMGYQDMLRTFVEDYCSGRPWQTPSMDRIASELRLVHAAYRSIDSGRFEEI